jgi:hypothetical protein
MGGTTVSGNVTRLDGSPEHLAYITATLGETTSMMAVGPVSRAANPRGQIMLPLDLTEPTQVHLRLSVPGRTLREATVTLKPGMAYTLDSVFSGEATPTPAPQTGTPDVHVSGDGDTAAISGVVSDDGDTIIIGG